MADLTTMRMRGHALGRMILSVFVVSWLSVSLQPCLMAMESDASPAMATGHAAHFMQDSVSTSPEADDHCGNCPPAASAVNVPCEVEMSATCQADMQCSLDNRRDRLLLNDVKIDIPVSITSTIADDQFANYKIPAPGIRFVAYTPGYQAPLNLLNCVYLI